jgi:hypothetical protein
MHLDITKRRHLTKVHFLIRRESGTGKRTTFISLVLIRLATAAQVETAKFKLNTLWINQTSRLQRV